MIVTILGIIRIILGPFNFPIIPLLQGGGVLLRFKFYSTKLHGGDRLRCGNYAGMGQG